MWLFEKDANFIMDIHGSSILLVKVFGLLNIRVAILYLGVLFFQVDMAGTLRDDGKLWLDCLN